ncbi:MAG: anti-sigma factor [Acidobacteria bacterium]|nr:anti-sigma factor [Acidobacteriota bacterium]
MSERDYLTCKQVIEDFLHDYVAGALDAPTRAEFERHLGVCPACVNYLDSYRTTIALSRARSIASRPPTRRPRPRV